MIRVRLRLIRIGDLCAWCPRKLARSQESDGSNLAILWPRFLFRSSHSGVYRAGFTEIGQKRQWTVDAVVTPMSGAGMWLGLMQWCLDPTTNNVVRLIRCPPGQLV